MSGAGCSHFGTLVSDPVTATNQWPEHRCSSCGEVVIGAWADDVFTDEEKASLRVMQLRTIDREEDFDVLD